MRTILIVDDDEDDKDLLCEAIHEVDNTAQCFWASDGIYALSLLADENFLPPHYIFLDLNMPRLGGKECLSKIRSIPRLIDVPVIIYTTSKLQDNTTDLMKLGAVHFLTKPTRLSVLKEHVANVFAGRWELIDQVIITD